jgi:hypothetical protein
MTRFIGIHGKKQHGKDTLANYMAEVLQDTGLTVKRVSFADPLKRACGIVFGLSLNDMYGSDADKSKLTSVLWDTLPYDVRCRYGKPLTTETNEPRSGPMTVREVLQVIGTDVFRELVDRDVWAKAPFKQRYEEDFVILADCRFINEMEAIKNNNGYVIKIVRPGVVANNHPSELALDHVPDSEFFDVVQNNGTTEDLANKAEDLVDRILETL